MGPRFPHQTPDAAALREVRCPGRVVPRLDLASDQLGHVPPSPPLTTPTGPDTPHSGARRYALEANAPALAKPWHLLGHSTVDVMPPRAGRQFDVGVDSAADFRRSSVCSIVTRLCAARSPTPLTGFPSAFTRRPRWSIQVSVTRHPVAVVSNA